MVKKVVASLEDITKSFSSTSQNLPVLNGVSLDIYEGQVIAVLGPSGSGKSTLLNILGMLLTPDSGKYKLAEEHVEDMTSAEQSSARLRKISFVFQSFHLIEHKTIIENVELPLKYLGFSKANRLSKSKEILDKLGLSDRLETPIASLSGGEKQRVALARALVTEPILLLCDEPTGSLDSSRTQEVIEMLRGHTNSGRATVIVTHDLEVAKKCDRVITIKDGQIEENLTIEPEESIDALDSKNNEEDFGYKNSWLTTTFSEAINSSLRRFRRNLLIILGISLGVSSLVLTVGMTSTISYQISQAFNVFLSQQMVLTQTSKEPLSVEEAIGIRDSSGYKLLKNLNGVNETALVQTIGFQVSVERSLRSNAEGGDSEAVTDILAVTPSFFSSQGQIAIDGVLFTDDYINSPGHVAVVAESLLNDLGVVWVPGLSIFVGETQLDVIGVVEDKPHHPDLNGRVYLPLGSSLYGQPVDKTRILLSTDSGAANQVGREAVVVLNPARPSLFAPGVVPQPENLKHSIDESQQSLLISLSGLMLVISAVGIANTFLVAVLERRSEIGLRKALGVTPFGITAQFLIESVITSLFGAIFGIYIAVNIIIAVCLLNSWTPVLDYQLVLIGVVSGLLVGSVAGFYPAYRASKVDAIQALTQP